jgi:anthranilate phosphoribosyltransferase
VSLFRAVLTTIIDGRDLGEEQAHDFMLQLMQGEYATAQISAFLAAYEGRGHRDHELAAFVRAMRSQAQLLHSPLPLVDTCGTGGDGKHTFNISTAAAFIAAGAGIPVAKHHNRAVSSRCGSADVLAALGVDNQLPPERVEQAMQTYGLAFCFAPLFHPAMRFAAPARQALGLRTVFNSLGPLLNPFSARRQIVGVFARQRVPFMAAVMVRLGTRRALVVHGEDGLDEATLSGKTFVAEVDSGALREYTLQPGDLDLPTYPEDAYNGGDAADNAAILRDVLADVPGAPRDIALLNAALAIYVGKDGLPLHQALHEARHSLASGAALAKYEELRRFSEGN